LARVITLVEDRTERGRRLQEQLFARTGKAQVIGVTGSPGAGKSTLVDQLATTWRAAGKQVAILAIDPSSPFSGGAVLGDRIRMSKTAEDPSIFIRSMATRGALGGLSRATLDTVQILDGAGFDVILLETVGVGQGEVDIVKTAHTCIVVMVPGMGDGVQAIKAGILEIADLFVINKADREGADNLQRDLRLLISLNSYHEGAWVPPILRTVATTGEGREEVIGESEKHWLWLQSTTEGQSRRKKLVREAILKMTSERLLERLLAKRGVELEGLAAACFDKALSPGTAVDQLLRD
jgi:LAO/AO transport system kinase